MDLLCKISDCEEFYKILNFDRITITVAPEKRGVVYRYFEYEVQSERYKTSVKRRYSDFIIVRYLLLSRFRYRLIPQLPPKQFLGNGEWHFVEHRRKRLEQFANLLARHPVIAFDSLWRFFLTEKNDDFRDRIKRTFYPPIEEFYIHDYSESDMRAMDMSKYPLVKEQLSLLQQSLMQLSQVAVCMASTSRNHVTQMLDFGKCAKALLSQDESIVFRSFNFDSNGDNLLLKFISISEETKSEAHLMESEIHELLDAYMGLLSAYKDLCVRYENELRKHSKLTNSNNNTLQPTDDTLEELERKSHFALHCLLSEANLIKTYSSTIPLIMNKMAKIKTGCYTQLFDSLQK